MNDPATRRVDLHAIDGQPFQPEQARRVGDDTLETLGQIQLIMRTLGQARDLALVTMNCRHSHDHRGHGSPTSTTHQTPLPAQVRRAGKGLEPSVLSTARPKGWCVGTVNVHVTQPNRPSAALPASDTARDVCFIAGWPRSNTSSTSTIGVSVSP